MAAAAAGVAGETAEVGVTEVVVRVKAVAREVAAAAVAMGVGSRVDEQEPGRQVVAARAPARRDWVRVAAVTDRASWALATATATAVALAVAGNQQCARLPRRT
jgi:hypothetical protein